MAGNLYKRGRLYYYDFTFEGKRYNASTGCEYRSQAQMIMRKKMAEIIDGKCRPNKRNHLKFNKLAKQFLEWSRDHRKGTYRRDIQIVNHLNRFFDKVWIDNITPIEIEKYMKQRRREVSGSTVNREVQTLRRIFNLAISWHIIDANPAKSGSVSFYPEPPKTHRWVRPDEVNLLLRECEGKLRHLYGIILVAVHTGMRKSELFKLKWEYVDLENGTLIIKHAKHYRNRYIPLNDEVIAVLRYEVPKRGEYVFAHRDGSPLSRVDKSLATAVKLAGIQKCTLHDFRATWATELLASGEDIETVRKLGGWRDYTTILRYLEAIPERQKSACNKLMGKYESRHFSRQLQKAKTPDNVISIKTIAPVAQSG
jgi:integrase